MTHAGPIRSIWKRTRLGIVAAVWAASVIAAAPQANAATTVGANLFGSPAATACFSACTVAIATLPEANRALGGLTVQDPGGVIVRWRVRTGTDSDALAKPVALRVLTGNTGGASGPVEVLPVAAGTYTFNARIPVAAGQRPAIDLLDPGMSGVSILAAATGASSHFWNPPLQAGVERTPSNQGTLYPNINVDVEPDADGDVFGDESQDQCPGIAGPENGCPPQPEPQPEPQAGDVIAPSVQITKGPKDKTMKKQATFEFTGTDARAVAGFQCSLDDDPLETCASPHTVKVKKGKLLAPWHM